MPHTTDFSGAFCKAFINKIKSQGFRANEVNLFRALQDAFTGMRDKFAIEEYHGSSRQVVFSGYSSNLARCELADLLIIAYSKKQKEVRMTFLQAKFERKEVKAPKKHKYSLNLKQLFLLGKRPTIKGCGKFNPPPDLLSSALLETVGTFLFFYNIPGCKTLKPEVFFCSAGRLAWPMNPAKTHRCKTNYKMQKRASGKPAECLMAENMSKFARNLYQLKIGTPLSLCSTDKSTKWLASVLKKMTTANPEKILSKELLDLISNGRSDNIPQKSKEFGAKTLIIINTDFPKDHSSFGTRTTARRQSLCRTKSHTV